MFGKTRAATAPLIDEADLPPAFSLLMAEARMLPALMRTRARPEVKPRARVGDGSPVVTLPGFCADDEAMRQLRLNLNEAGFAAKRWKLGRNFGAQIDTLDRIDERVRYVANKTGRKVHLVGWSLGGIMAREYAKAHPGLVASVITLGSPFSGSMKANHAWRLYEMIAGHKVDEPPVPLDFGAKPPVPTYALWSPHDGIVSAATARGTPEQSDVQRELQCTHIGLAFEDEAIDAIIDCLAEISPRETPQ